MVDTTIYSPFRRHLVIGLLLCLTGVIISQSCCRFSDQVSPLSFQEQYQSLVSETVAQWESQIENDQADRDSRLNNFIIEKKLDNQTILWKSPTLRQLVTDHLALDFGVHYPALNDSLSYQIYHILGTDEPIIWENGWWCSTISHQSTSKTSNALVEQSTGQEIYFETPVKIVSSTAKLIYTALIIIGLLILLGAPYLAVAGIRKKLSTHLLVAAIGLTLLFNNFDIASIALYPIFGIQALLLSLDALRYRRRDESPSSEPSVFNILLRLGSITLSSVLAVFCIQWLVRHGILDIDAERIFYSSAQEMLSISALIIGVSATFISHLAILGQTSTFSAKNQQVKLIGFAIGIILCWLAFRFLQDDINPWILTAGLIIYFFLLDLFADQRVLNITKVILWAFISSSLLSLLLFGQHTLVERDQISKNLTDIWLQPNPKTRVHLEQLKTTLNPKALQAIADTKITMRTDESDALNFLASQSADLARLKEQFDLELIMLDSLGAPIINTPEWRLSDFRDRLSLVNYDEHRIGFNPIHNEYLLHLDQSSNKIDSEPFETLDAYLIFTESGESKEEYYLGVVKDDQVIYRSSDRFDAPEKQENFKKKTSQWIENGIQYNSFQIDNNTTVYTASNALEIIKPISLFSFIFCLTAIIYVILGLGDRWMHYLPDYLRYGGAGSSLRNRIQLLIVLLIVFSFIIIGVVTVYYFYHVSESTAAESSRDDITSIRKSLTDEFSTFDNTIEAEYWLSGQLSKLAESYGTDIILYDKFGQATNSTVAQLAGHRVPFNIWQANDGQAIQTESISVKGSKYISSTAALATNDLGTIGYLKLLNRPSASSYNNINDFLGTLLNVYVFLFLIASALALFVANLITEPIAKIGTQMRQFKLGKQNQTLDWKKDDEIGALVSEYNAMISKLDASADFIAKTERDFAWREMAKQVAHEIKNPLTPMKLSIQYLEKAANRDPHRAKELIDNVSVTLIEQIDNLTQIANEFSNFAKIPEGENKKVILNEVVEAVHDLFRKRDDMDIQMNEPIDEVLVHADRNHLVRILNNLVKNAIQAIPTDRSGIIQINLYTENNNAIVMVQDNGCGIPDAMTEQVFVPNFTTKSSGTGLGLAISANMAESFNARIYFESSVNIGTKFYLEIPLLRTSPDFSSDPKRLVLD